MPISFHIKSGGDFLNCRLWLPEKPRGEGVVFCHGWGGGAQYDDLLERLAAAGYHALRLDQRGYGGSTGRGDLSLWAVDMAACSQALLGVVGKVWAAGQSTGGTMALVAAATEDSFAGAVAIAPFASLPRILEDNPGARAILEARFGPLEEKHFRAADALEIVAGLKKPALIVQGTKDATVPFEHGRRLYQKLEKSPPGARHLPIDGGDHHLRNVERGPVLDDIVAWLKSQ